MKVRSFTIIEVIVAVAIVAVLAAIVIPDLWAAQQRITGEMFMNNVHDIITTLELYKKQNNGLYPEQIEELESYYDKQPINSYTKSSMLISDNYRSGIQYIPSSDLKSYTLLVTQKDINDLDRDKNKTETVAEALGQPFSFVNVQPITPTVARTYIVTLRAVPNNTGQLVAFPNPAKAGQTVMLSQKPANCYNFGSWSSPDVTITNNSFVMPAKDVTVTANYTVRQYTVSVAPNNPSYGTVTGSGTYDCGSTATLTAEPNTGYTFVGWYESGISLTASTVYIFTVSSTRTLEARFKQVEYHTITIIETTQTDFSSGTLANVTATNGNITLDGQNQPNEEIIQQNTPYILPDAFWNGSEYKYIVFATSTPNFTGGSGVSIINRGNPAQTSNVGNSYEITSSTRITSITANGVTLSNFTYREGDIFWYGPWWWDAVEQTIPSGYDIAFAIGRTENLGTSSWVVQLDGVDTAFSTNVANHYFRAPINSSTSHSILVTYIEGNLGIQFAYWGYAKAYPSSGTRTSPTYNIVTAGTVESATITWTANTPVGTSVTVETRVSLDGGATWSSWQITTSGSAVPGLPKGTNLANARIQLRQTLSTTNSAVTPQLQDVRIQIVSTATGGD